VGQRCWLGGMDARHRLFAVVAGAWALVAPWFVSDSCNTGTVREHAIELFGVSRWNCDQAWGDFAVVLMVCAIPCLLAYLAIFVAGPVVARWVTAGDGPR